MGSENEDDQLLEVEVGRMRNSGDRRERGPRGNPRDFCGDGVDQNLDSIKMKIPSFQSKNNPEVYLEWEKKLAFFLTLTSFSYFLLL